MEEEFIEIALDILPTEELLHIMKKMTPESIIKLCQINRLFYAFCNNNTIWIELLKEHYSKFNITSNPKEQYKALVQNKITYYNFTDDDEDEVIVTSEKTNLKIIGLPFEKDTLMWVAIYENNSDPVRYTIFQSIYEVFRTKDEAIDYFMNNYFLDLLDDLRVYADNEYGDVNNDMINQSANDMYLPVPFNEISVREKLSNTSSLDTLRHIDDGQRWFVGQILFKAKLPM